MVLQTLANLKPGDLFLSENDHNTVHRFEKEQGEGEKLEYIDCSRVMFNAGAGEQYPRWVIVSNPESTPWNPYALVTPVTVIPQV